MRRWVAIGAAVIVTALMAVVARPVFHLTRAAIVHAPRDARVPVDFADDAGRLSKTRVARVVPVDPDSAGAEAQLRVLLVQARRQRTRVSIAGARHTMGGHTITPSGVQLDMANFARIQLSPATGVLTVGAGARWADVIPFLDVLGRSVAVMQSNNSFSVGGTLSANAHGWQHDHGPMVSSVVSMRLLMADGTIRRLSRTENPDLFRAVIGGYGAFGVILDAELETVPNEMYRIRRYPTTASDYERVYAEQVSGRANVGMAYGRLSVAPNSFLTEASLAAFERDSSVTTLPPVTTPGLLGIKRAVLRGSEGSDYGKELRWKLEKWFGELPGSTQFTRNQLLNEPAEFIANTSEKTTDVLHEYFIPRGQLAAFVERIRPILRESNADLLNITIRSVDTDSVTLLAYARRPVWGLVMLFVQERTPDGEARMQALTRRMIDAANDVGGTYYLPYRLHATPEQFRRAYPRWREFQMLKKRHDPEWRFSNLFLETYIR